MGYHKTSLSCSSLGRRSTHFTMSQKTFDHNRTASSPSSGSIDEKADVAQYEYPVDGKTAESGNEYSELDGNIDHGYDPAFVKKAMRKVDWRLIPPLIAMYCISSIDRKNVSLARAANNEAMQKELQLGTDRYNIITLMFFPTYIIFEIPVS